MNIFKSKEIYKKTTTLPGDDELRVVRGMWVSGEHLEPYCIDSVIHVDAVKSDHCDIVEYSATETEFFMDKGSVNIIDIDKTDFEVLTYTMKSDESHDGIVNIIDVTTNDFEVFYFTSLNQDAYSDGMLNIIQMNINFLEVMNDMPHDYGTSTPEPMLHILLHGSSDLEM